MKPTACLIGLSIALTCTQTLAYTCSVAATALNFGVVEGRGNQAWRSTATLTVVCQGATSAVDVSYQLFSDGSGSGERSMAGAGGGANYQLYTSADYQRVWGDTAGSAISDSYSLAANSSQTRVYTVYARMLPGRQAAPGAYTALSTVRLVY